MDLSKDTLAFAREKRRMCVAMKSCRNCELNYNFCELGTRRKDEEADKRILSYVQAWSDAHPQKTYLQDFIEKFPSYEMAKKGVPRICRDALYKNKRNCLSIKCVNCWNETLE